MEAEAEKYRVISLEDCQRLLYEVRRDQEDAALFFGGEIYKTYVAATDKVINKAEKIRTQIRNL